MSIATLLKVRKQVKARKPVFLAQGTHKHKEIRKRWRRPKGMHSKMRLRKKGYGKHVEIGYRSPREVRGMHRNGLMPVVVSSAKGLESIREGQGVVLSAALGMKKRAALAREAQAKKLTLLNVNPEAYEKTVIEALAARKKKAETSAKKRMEAEEKKKKAAKDEKGVKKAATAEGPTEEERKIQEKKEKDKLLTKKE